MLAFYLCAKQQHRRPTTPFAQFFDIIARAQWTTYERHSTHRNATFFPPFMNERARESCLFNRIAHKIYHFSKHIVPCQLNESNHRHSIKQASICVLWACIFQHNECVSKQKLDRFTILLSGCLQQQQQQQQTNICFSTIPRAKNVTAHRTSSYNYFLALFLSFVRWDSSRVWSNRKHKNETLSNWVCASRCVYTCKLTLTVSNANANIRFRFIRFEIKKSLLSHMVPAANAETAAMIDSDAIS